MACGSFGRKRQTRWKIQQRGMAAFLTCLEAEVSRCFATAMLGKTGGVMRKKAAMTSGCSSYVENAGGIVGPGRVSWRLCNKTLYGLV